MDSYSFDSSFNFPRHEYFVLSVSVSSLRFKKSKYFLKSTFTFHKVKVFYFELGVHNLVGL